LKKKLLLYFTALFADAYKHQEGKDIQKKNKFPFIPSLISLCSLWLFSSLPYVLAAINLFNML